MVFFVNRLINSWVIVVELGRDPVTKKRRQQWQSIKGTKKDAEREMRVLLTSLETGTYLKPTKMTLGEYLERWLRDYVQTNVRPKTAEGYVNKINRHILPELGQIPLTDLKPSHIQEFYRLKLESGRVDGEGGLGPSTVNQMHRILSASLRHAVKWGLVGRNVAEAVDPPRIPRNEPHTLDSKDVNTLLEAIKGTPYHPVFHLAIYTGLRRSELLGLRWRDIDLDMATLSIVQTRMQLPGGKSFFQEPKTSKGRRQVALSPSSVLMLREYREQQELQSIMAGWVITPDSPVFCYEDGSPILPDTITHVFIKFARKVGLHGVRFHDLRHTHASLMLKQGIHPKVVSERMGHSTVSITLDVYSHVTPGIQQAAALAFEEVVQTA
ncbi:MAG: site-specific integrase [Chloroflexi bacterium]|nr:site-specific integrase [Chloroflexota bacterium]